MIIQDANVGEYCEVQTVVVLVVQMVVAVAVAAVAAVAGPEEPVGLAGVLVHLPC